MTTELRWLERNGEKVLQYRSHTIGGLINGANSDSISSISDWQDVPTVKEPRKVEFWLNVYDSHLPHVFQSKAEAKMQRTPDCVAIIKVTGIEGQYDE